MMTMRCGWKLQKKKKVDPELNVFVELRYMWFMHLILHMLAYTECADLRDLLWQKMATFIQVRWCKNQKTTPVYLYKLLIPANEKLQRIHCTAIVILTRACVNTTFLNDKKLE